MPRRRADASLRRSSSAAANKKVAVPSGAPKKKKKSGAAKKFKKKPLSQKGISAPPDGSRLHNPLIHCRCTAEETKESTERLSPAPGPDGCGDSQADRASGSEDDYSDDGDEGTEGYKQGGYHPVHIGDIFNFRYVVLQKLGWGHFSTVWMCLDRARVDGSPQYVAMKVQKSAPHYREAAFDEIELLNCIKKASQSAEYRAELQAADMPVSHKNVVILLDHFEHTGPNGRHVCMVFEMLGENLLSVIKKYDYKGIPIDIVRSYTLQICRGLDFMHRHASIIHTDLKPENILIAEPPPIPPEEFVKALIEMGPIKSKKVAGSTGPVDSTVTNGKRKARKGKGKKGKGDGRGGLNAAAGSVEAKKRMKKKQKKKRQKANRKDPGGSVEAKGVHSKGLVTAANLALSADEEAKEMMMMEKASEPVQVVSRLSEIALREAGSRGSADSKDDSDAGSFSGRYDRDDKKGSGDKFSMNSDDDGDKKGSRSSSAGNGKADDSSDHRAEAKRSFSQGRVDSFGAGSVDDSMYEGGEDYNDEDADEGLALGTSASLRLQVSAYHESSGKPVDRDRDSVCSKVLLGSCQLSWLRPTLFAFLNFSSVSEELDSSPEPHVACSLSESDSDCMFLYHLQQDDNAEYLDSPFSAKISMVSISFHLFSIHLKSLLCVAGKCTEIN